MPLLDNMAAVGRLPVFIEDTLAQIVTEKEDKQLWELYLHKVFDNTTFSDFKEQIKGAATAEKRMSDHEFNSIVEQSEQILQGFIPIQPPA